MQDILQKTSEIKNAGKTAALCIIVNTKGSSPGKTGAKMIVYPDGTIEGTVGGGKLEFRIIKEALIAIDEQSAKKFDFQLDADLGMSCGGFTEVYIEPIIGDLPLYIFGGGHIGKALARYAPDFGFQMTIIDPRDDNSVEGFPGNVSIIKEEYVEAISGLEFTDNTYIVIVTPQHKNDEAVLEVVAKKNHAYIGMIGSRTKIAKARKRFSEEKILSDEILDSIDMPIGIKFNAQTPEEIALSILAKMIDVKNSNQ